jgi:hypothetical protein
VKLGVAELVVLRARAVAHLVEVDVALEEDDELRPALGQFDGDDGVGRDAYARADLYPPGVHPREYAQQLVLTSPLQRRVEPLHVLRRGVAFDDESERARPPAEPPADADDRAEDVAAHVPATLGLRLRRRRKERQPRHAAECQQPTRQTSPLHVSSWLLETFDVGA